MSFDREDYYANPSEWQSLFSERVRTILLVMYFVVNLSNLGYALRDAFDQRYWLVIRFPFCLDHPTTGKRYLESTVSWDS
jgi:membrane-anchored protein YejM (alkaline phosphatase superfamily)